MKNKVKISYEPEADVLSWEVSGKTIDTTKEIGNVVIHFSKNNQPVVVEILEASKFFTRAKRPSSGHVKRLEKKTFVTA